MSSNKAEEEELLSSPGLPAPNAKRPSRRWLLNLLYLFLCILVVDVLVELLKGPSKQLLTSTALGEIYPETDDLCQVCDCKQNPPVLQASRRIKYTSRGLMPAFIQSHILDIQCKHIYANIQTASGMIKHSTQKPERTFAWDVSGLKDGLPTSYVFTKTSPAGKTSTQRPGYIQRHVDAFTEAKRFVDAKGQWFDGVAAADRQSIWIIVEDSFTIDEEVALVLARSKLNYIYFAFGPTRNYGNAQHNAALSMIHALSTEVLKGGPVFGVDDDAEIHPDLLQLIWKVKKAGMWPIGNLGPTGWEGPIVDQDGKIVSWSAANTYRVYPIDNNAFAFNSNLLGSSLLPGPAFWPTDLNGGESEFMETILASRDELEVLCKDCHVAWHNHPLGVPHVDDLTYESGGKPW